MAVDQLLDSVTVVLSDEAGNEINAKMSNQTQVDVSEMANRSDYKVSDAHPMADNEQSGVNSTEQTQSNNNTTNQINACNIQMDTIESTIAPDNSECSLNGLETNDVTEVVSPPKMSSVPIGAADANSVKYLPTTPTVTRTNLSPIDLSPCRNTMATTTTIIDSSSDDDFDEIQKLFETKPLAIEKWLRERAPQDVLMKMHAATECVRTPQSPKLRTPSVTSDLFQQWLATSPVQVCTSKIVKCRNEFIEINDQNGKMYEFTLSGRLIPVRTSIECTRHLGDTPIIVGIICRWRSFTHSLTRAHNSRIK